MKLRATSNLFTGPSHSLNVGADQSDLGLHRSPAEKEEPMVKTFTRIAVAGAAVVTVLTVSASPALADTNKTIYYPSGRGKMTYIDDGDMFQVCDTKADGHGMTGMVEDLNHTILIITDGGDAGCDKDGYDVGQMNSVRMALSWDGGGGTITSGYFNE
ncbi:hypothetical protein [Streptomyces sp. NPDC002889]|uniref:hypothetical protein n=1 Tax=Streptomyces sp. NPDC002889 TaxID=3364669 RepID=UPI003690C5AA